MAFQPSPPPVQSVLMRQSIHSGLHRRRPHEPCAFSTGKLMDFFQSSTGGNGGLIQAGYMLDGGSLSKYAAEAFIGPATAGALVDARFQPFLNDLWTYSSAHLSHGYYETVLQLLSLIVASQNWWNP